MKYLLLLLPLLLLGCADSSTTGSIRNYDIRVDIANNSGPVSLTFPLNVDSASNTDQTTENASDIAPDVRLQLTEGGGTGAMSGADAVLKDVTSKLKKQIKVRALEETKEEFGVEPTPEEPVDLLPPPTQEDPEIPTPEDPPAVDDPSTGSSQTFGNSGFANGRQGWRVPDCGAKYTTPLEFKFSSGFTRVVEDLSKRIEDSNGFLVRPGTCKQEAGDPSKNQEWTSHGGMYVHAPFGDKSTELTLTMAE